MTEQECRKSRAYFFYRLLAQLKHYSPTSVILAALLMIMPLVFGQSDSAQNKPVNKEAAEFLNQAMKAFGDQDYNAAAQLFEKAIQADPNFEVARLCLATFYVSQFVPGSADPNSEKTALKAIETYEYIANYGERFENKRNAMISIAGLYYNLKRANESKEWCYKLLKLDPNAAEAYYRIAVVDFDLVYDKTGAAGENIEYMSPEEKVSTKAAIEEGLTCLEKAIQIQPQYTDAMEYQNFLLREKAKFETDEKVKTELIRKADELSLKVVKMKLKAREEAIKPKN